MTLFFGFLFRTERLAQRGVFFLFIDNQRLFHRTAARPTMPCGLLLGLTLFGLITALAGLFLLLLRLSILAFAFFRRRYRHVFRRGNR